MHTLSSDGHATLEAMARRCIELGYTHMAVTDHSEGLRIAHGMDAATRAAQATEVRALNAVFASEGQAFTILHGLEMNVEPDGTGDTDPAVLSGLDIVLGAFHSKLRLLDDQTDRYIRALRNPTVDVMAHPRGRIYNHRVGLTARWEEVFEAAAELGVALEVDAYPARQDLDVELLRLAARHQVWIAVDTDSHHPVDLDAMPLGIAAVIAAGVPRERVINTFSHDELLEWVARRRGRARSRPG
jgi:histidinol phosphatase-like PHP family hydrolase